MTLHLDPALVPAYLRGSYAGKSFKAKVCESVTIPSHAGLWDGGSRDTYALVELTTGKTVPASDNLSAPWNNARTDRTIELQPGYAVIEHTIFQGKDLGLTFYLHPQNATAYLPKPVELTPYEKTVLEATCSFKSSYAGRDRYQMAFDDCRYSHAKKRFGLDDSIPFPTRDQWEAAKAALISRGFLNKAGAVTVSGRNARNSISA